MNWTPSWNLYCPWCPYYIEVNARGAHGNDPGSGVEAANIMEEHAQRVHNHTWKEFLAERKYERFIETGLNV